MEVNSSYPLRAVAENGSARPGKQAIGAIQIMDEFNGKDKNSNKISGCRRRIRTPTTWTRTTRPAIRQSGSKQETEYYYNKKNCFSKSSLEKFQDLLDIFAQVSLRGTMRLYTGLSASPGFKSGV